MIAAIQDLFSLNLLGVLLWAMCVEIRQLPRNGRQR